MLFGKNFEKNHLLALDSFPHSTEETKFDCQKSFDKNDER